MDVVDKATRSRMMAGIKGRDTQPELKLRKALHARGLRYRVHVKDLPGRPDIALNKFGAVVFVHGCFWHRHLECRFCAAPTSRPDFWQAKFRANVERDRSVRQALTTGGWRVATIWECALRGRDRVLTTSSKVIDWLKSDIQSLELGEHDVVTASGQPDLLGDERPDS